MGREGDQHREQKKRWKGGCQKPKPMYIGHGTSVQNALSILQAGAIWASPGKCGYGVYGFAAEDEAAQATLWARSTIGGHCEGALFTMKVHGIVLLPMAKDDVIPDGACTRLGDQVAVAPGSLEYINVTFNIEALTEALGDQLDQLGYTLSLRTALMNLKVHLVQ